jgi:competence protein ComEC
MTTPPEKLQLHQSNPRAPLAADSVTFGLGIWLASVIHRPAGLWATAAFLLMLCAALAAYRKSFLLGHVSGGMALVAAGALAWVWMPPPNLTTPPEGFLFSEKIEVTGHVTNDGAMLAGRGPRERFDLETEMLEIDGIRFSQPVGMRATLFSRLREDDHTAQNGGFPQLAYGDRVKFAAKLRMPRNFRNPGAFDYEGYLHGLGITTMASVAANEIELLPGKTGDTLGFWRSRCRSSILRHVHGLWNDEDAALFAAMIVGDDSLLLRQVREEFQETGVYHLLVVSGMNVGLLALAVFWMARLLRAPQWIAALITIALSVFYAFVAGMGAPILRAVFMLSIYLLGRLFYRDRSALNATGFAALVVLVLSPHAWFEPSFQLTFLALLAISGISLPLLDRTSARLGRALNHFDSASYDLTLPPRLAQFRIDLRMISRRLALITGNRTAGFLVRGVVRSALIVYDLLVVSSVTQAVLVLPMRLYFHRAAIVGLPANLLVLPLAGLLMNSAVAAIALSYISAFLAHIAAVIASSTLHWTLLLIVSLSRWNISQWRVPDPDLLVVLVSVAGVIVALAAVHGRRPVVIAGTAVLFISALVAALYRPAPTFEPGKLEITAIDVGQGDSLLVVSPEGKTLLVDGGGAIGPFRGEFDYGEDVVSPYLWSRGLDHLDVIALSHAHDDHLGGLPRTLQNFHPKELWVGINPESAPLIHLFELAQAGHTEIFQLTSEDSFDWAGMHVRALSPPPDWQPKPTPRNDDSLALLLSYGHTSALMAGDLEKKMERFVATESPQADLLKVAHHGSNTSTTPELLAAVQPRFAVISAGAHNSFGHPRYEVLERLSEAHVKTYRTDRLGVVTFLLDGKNVEVKLAAFHQ